MNLGIDGRYAVLRYTTIIVGVLNAFLLPFVLNRTLDEGQFSIFLILIGYSQYLVFFDFGYSKPVYSLLRIRFLNSQLIKPLLKSALISYLVLFCVQFIFFGLLSFFILYFSGSSFPKDFIIFFSFYTSLTTTFIYLKSIFWAISSQKFIEYIDLCLRFANVLTYALILYTGSLVFPYFVSTILTTFLLVFTAMRLNVLAYKFRPNLAGVKNIYRNIMLIRTPLKQEARNNFLFAINETLIYNSGFLIIPYFYAPFEIILFALFSRLFSGIAIFVRALSDITIHNITENFFENKFRKAEILFNWTVTLSFVLSLLGFGLYLITKDFLFGTWVHKRYEFSKILDFSLFIFLASNSIQHVSGTFLTMVGGHFSILKRLSFIIVVSTIIFQFCGGFLGFQIDELVLISACVYALGSIIYLIKSRRILAHD
jgi:hypothetical protein